MNKRDTQIAIPAIIPAIIPITSSTSNSEIQSIFETIMAELLGLEIKSDLSSVKIDSNSKLFWGSAIISDKIVVNFAASVIDLSVNYLQTNLNVLKWISTAFKLVTFHYLA